MRTSPVLTAAIGTNWVMTLCMSTVHVGNLGKYLTVQLSGCSLTLSGSACFATFWLAGSGASLSHCRTVMWQSLTPEDNKTCAWI